MKFDKKIIGFILKAVGKISMGWGMYLTGEAAIGHAQTETLSAIAALIPLLLPFLGGMLLDLVGSWVKSSRTLDA